VDELPQRAADESGTNSLTTMFAGGRSVVRGALVALSREPPAKQFHSKFPTISHRQQSIENYLITTACN